MWILRIRIPNTLPMLFLKGDAYNYCYFTVLYGTVSTLLYYIKNKFRNTGQLGGRQKGEGFHNR
jgi:hypothetical protein